MARLLGFDYSAPRFSGLSPGAAVLNPVLSVPGTVSLFFRVDFWRIQGSWWIHRGAARMLLPLTGARWVGRNQKVVVRRDFSNPKNEQKCKCHFVTCGVAVDL